MVNILGEFFNVMEKAKIPSVRFGIETFTVLIKLLGLMSPAFYFVNAMKK